MKFETIMERYKNLAVCLPREILERHCLEQNADGWFSSVLKEIAEKGNRFYFLQCCVLRELAVGFSHDQDMHYGKAIKRGIDGWRQAKLQGTSNWFYHSILIPRKLLDVLLFAGDYLDEEQKRYLEAEVFKAYTEERYVYDIGANIIWTNTILLHLACYWKDENLFSKAADRINEEMCFGDSHSASDRKWRNEHWRRYVSNPIEHQVYEGVQRDYSFFEHGPLLQTGAYGRVYLFSLLQLMYECEGTDTLKAENCRFVIDFLLEHYRWTMVHETQDYNVIGRKIGSKDNPDKRWSSMEPDMDFLQALELAEKWSGSYRIQEIKETRKRLERGETAVEGIRYFPEGKYMVSQSKGFSVTIRMTCKDLLASESVNWENLKCWHLGDGVSYVYTDGKDYDGVFPVYDWGKIPGTTVEEKRNPVLDWKQHIAVNGSESPLCGGAAYEECGAAAMELKKEGLRAKKSWFFIEGEWVCLGTDIWCDGEGEVITTVNQMRKRQKIWINGTLSEGKLQQENCAWVGHCGVAYLFSKGQRIRIASEKRRGDWNEIAYDQWEKRPDTPFLREAHMTALWLEHGRKPENASYEYHIMPWKQGETPKKRIRIIANNSSVQAVSLEDCSMAVFWGKGELEMGGRLWKAENPCIVTIRRKAVCCSDLREWNKRQKR